MVQLDAVIMNDFHGGYIATCPSLSSCHGRGGTRDKAVRALREAIAEALAGEMTLGPDELVLRLREQCACGAGWPLSEAA